jgi:predicted RNA-binding Zn ribbon-like protein
MNLFTVLSQGRGRLNEENLSAMLGYLLSPTQTHGLGDSFLRPFLVALADACGEPHRSADVAKSGHSLRAEVLLEEPYELGRRRRVVDMEVRLFARTLDPVSGVVEDAELHRIAIENKVKVQAADPTQLAEEFVGIVRSLEEDENVAVTMVLLTPPGDAPRFAEEFAALEMATAGPHRKAWLRWAGADGEARDVVGLLRELLRREADAIIAPIADYLRHTIKAFIRHIEDGPAGSTGRVRQPRGSLEQGEVVEVLAVRLGDTTYQIERYESTTIRVFNTGRQEYEVAKPILRLVNDEKALGINLWFPTGRLKNTRALGREVMRELVAQGKVAR